MGPDRSIPATHDRRCKRARSLRPGSEPASSSNTSPKCPIQKPPPARSRLHRSGAACARQCRSSVLVKDSGADRPRSLPFDKSPRQLPEQHRSQEQKAESPKDSRFYRIVRSVHAASSRVCRVTADLLVHAASSRVCRVTANLLVHAASSRVCRVTANLLVHAASPRCRHRRVCRARPIYQ